LLGCTQLLQWAFRALGLARHAHGCAEFHHGLIEISGPGVGEKRLRMLPGLRRGEIDAGKSLQHTLDIAIDHGYGLGERDAGDGGGGVASNAGQGEQGFGILREPAIVLFGNLLRGLTQHAGAPIVAQTAPGGQHSLFRSGGERLDIRKTFEENPVVVKHGGHARLLQHDFAEPDAVGITSYAPGKVAAMPIVPAEQRAPESGQVLAGRWNWRRGEPRLYGDGTGCAHYCWLTLCAMATHPAFCCCHTVIMCCGAEGSGCEPAVPFKMAPFRVMVYVTTMVVPFNSVCRSPRA